MKQATFLFFRQFDLFSASASLRINTKPAMRSCMLGIFSLIIFSGLIYILVANFLTIINHQQINCQISQTIADGKETEGQVSMFAVTLGFMRLSRFNRYFDFHLHYYVEGKLQERVRLKNCKPQQWKQLGQNYTETFNSYSMELTFCPTITKPYKIRQTAMQTNSTSISIILTACNPKQRPDCNLTGLSSLLVRYRAIWLLLLDPVLHPEQQETTGYRITTVKAVMSLYNREYTQILLSMYRMETDLSLYPWENNRLDNGSMFNSVISNQYQNFQSKTLESDVFCQMSIQMNNKVKNIKRTIGKFDQVISYVGGLFAVIIPGLSWFLSSYNKYRYEIKVAEGAFNFDEHGNKIKEKDFHFGRYIQYTIYNWINAIFCMKLKWKRCNEIDQARESITAQMDSRSLFRRLQKIQQMIASKIDNNQDPCISLIQPLSIQNIRKQRIKLDYYDEVVKGEAAVTLEDLLLQEHRKNNSQNRQSLPRQISNNFEIGSAKGLNRMLSIDSSKSFDFNLIALDHGYHLVKQTVDFVKTKQIAQNIVLNPQFDEVQENLAKVYSQFDEPDKHLIENRVPMLILHRLNKKNKQNQEIRKIMGLLEIEEAQQQAQKQKSKQGSKLEQREQQKQEQKIQQQKSKKLEIRSQKSRQEQNKDLYLIDNGKQKQNKQPLKKESPQIEKEEYKNK